MLGSGIEVGSEAPELQAGRFNAPGAKHGTGLLGHCSEKCSLLTRPRPKRLVEVTLERAWVNSGMFGDRLRPRAKVSKDREDMRAPRVERGIVVLAQDRGEIVNASFCGFFESVRLLADVGQAGRLDRPSGQETDTGKSARGTLRVEALRFRVDSVVREDVAVGLDPHAIGPGRALCGDRETIARVQVDERSIEPSARIGFVRSNEVKAFGRMIRWVSKRCDVS